MPNKEPTKEWRGLAQEILDTVGSTKAARSKAWKENALQYIEIRIEEALKVREAELIEKMERTFGITTSERGVALEGGKPPEQYLPKSKVIALIKG